MKEEWKSVVGYEGKYEVSSLGKARGVRRVAEDGKRIKGKYLSMNSFTNGYRVFSLTVSGVTKQKKASILVAEAFIGPRPQGMVVCHNNSVRNDDRLENLRYDTNSSNMLDKRKNGTCNSGENSTTAKLTNKDVKEIRNLYDNFFISQSDIARRYNVTCSCISNVINKKTWKYV